MLHSMGDSSTTDFLDNLKAMLMGSELTVTDLYLLIDILSRMVVSDRLRLQHISDVFTIIDHMLSTNITELDSAKNTILFTKRTLAIIDGVLKGVRQESMLISRRNLLLYVRSTEGDHVIGASALSDVTFENASVDPLTTNDTQKAFRADGTVAFFLLPHDLVLERSLPFPCYLKTVFFRDWTLFPSPRTVLLKRNFKVLPSPVVSVALSGGPAWNLSQPVELYFRILGMSVEETVCVFYDVEAREWSREGCEYAGVVENFHLCRCHHLSIFSIVLSVSPEGESIYRLGTSVYVGCSISIVALAFCVCLYLLSKEWRKTVDQTILFHLSLSLLCCLLTLVLSETRFSWWASCFLLSLLLHFSLLASFGWLTVHSLVHKMRFCKKTDLEEVPYFHLKAAVCTWGGATVIIFVVWITRDYKYVNNCLMPMSETSRAVIIPIVVLLLVTFCLNVCAVYAITCRYQKDYLLENSSYSDLVVKFRVAFTIFFLFVLSWLFGLFALHNHYKELRVLFAICITITSYYVTLFFVFQETSLWDMCRKRKASTEKTVAYSAQN